MKIVHIPASKAEKEKTAGQWGSLRWMANQPLSGSPVAVARRAISNCLCFLGRLSVAEGLVEVA